MEHKFKFLGMVSMSVLDFLPCIPTIIKDYWQWYWLLCNIISLRQGGSILASYGCHTNYRSLDVLTVNDFLTVIKARKPILRCWQCGLVLSRSSEEEYNPCLFQFLGAASKSWHYLVCEYNTPKSGLVFILLPTPYVYFFLFHFI